MVWRCRPAARIFNNSRFQCLKNYELIHHTMASTEHPLLAMKTIVPFIYIIYIMYTLKMVPEDNIIRMMIPSHNDAAYDNKGIKEKKWAIIFIPLPLNGTSVQLGKKQNRWLRPKPVTPLFFTKRGIYKYII